MKRDRRRRFEPSKPLFHIDQNPEDMATAIPRPNCFPHSSELIRFRHPPKAERHSNSRHRASRYNCLIIESPCPRELPALRVQPGALPAFHPEAPQVRTANPANRGLTSRTRQQIRLNRNKQRSLLKKSGG